MHSASAVVVLSGFLLLVTPLIANETDPQSKIVGGEDVNIEDFPYQVSVQSFGSHMCGASIISKQHVLTTAHCCENNIPSRIQLKVGDEFFREGVKYLVEKITFHHDYNKSIIDNDICVMKVTQPFELNEKVAIIPLVDADTTFANGTNTTVSGWGEIYEDGPREYFLQAVSVPYLDHETCKHLYSPTRFHITDKMICTLDPNGLKDSCRGDSGGPLVATVNGKRVLIGVVSWGEGCARPDRPGVYASVAKYHSWITKTMANM